MTINITGILDGNFDWTAAPHFPDLAHSFNVLLQDAGFALPTSTTTTAAIAAPKTPPKTSTVGFTEVLFGFMTIFPI
jgi:hypothetical protein